MNKNQINLVQGYVDRYFQLDLIDLISTSFPSVDENSPVIGEYTAKEFLLISNKVFSQFREEFKGVYAKALPYQYQFHTEFGGGDLNTDLSQYLAFIEGSRFPNSIVHLSRLIQYQAVYGFWEKSKRKYFRHSEENLNEEKERISLVSSQLKKSTDQLQLILEEIDLQKEELSQFINVKHKELSEIESLLSASRMHNSEIIEIHSSVTSIVEKVKALLDSSDEKKEESELLYQKSKEILSHIDSTIKSQVKTIEKQENILENLKSKFESELSVVEKKTKYFTERNKYLDDLIGREVGASLFETFKQRKGELGSAIVFWKWSVPVTAIATIGWIFFLFGNGDLSNLSWQVIFVNSLKSLPAIGLLLFAISQYTKERNFQEEYAFKSAVALTINAYADQLGNKDKKDQMIIDSVSSVYKTPISSREKRVSESKTLIDTAKEITEVAKSIASKK